MKISVNTFGTRGDIQPYIVLSLGLLESGHQVCIPTVVIPSFGDQFFWGWQVHKTGAVPAPIPRIKLTVEALAAAIQQAVSDASIKVKAKELGQKIRAENGVENAARIVECFA